MTYEIANNKDIEQLVKMRLGYIECDQGSISDSNKSKMQNLLPLYFEKHLNKDLIAFIAKDNDVIVGTALLLIIEKPSNPHFINGKDGEVLNVFTLPEHQHKGIATTLIQSLIQYSKDNQLDRVSLSATDDGYPLYKKLGFVDVVSSYKEMRYTIS